MNREYMTVKEEAILFAKDKIEDASDALIEILPDISEELNWFREELGKELLKVRLEESDGMERFFEHKECAV
jgi:hypothetical protein